MSKIFYLLLSISQIIQNQYDPEFICEEFENLNEETQRNTKCNGICYRIEVNFVNSYKLVKQKCLEYDYNNLEEQRQHLHQLYPTAVSIQDGHCTMSKCIPSLNLINYDNQIPLHIEPAQYLPKASSDPFIVDPSKNKSDNTVAKQFTTSERVHSTSHDTDQQMKKHRINKVTYQNKIDSSKTNSLFNMQNTQLNCKWNLKMNDFDCAYEKLDDKAGSVAIDLKEQLKFDDLIANKDYIIKKFGIDYWRDVTKNIDKRDESCLKPQKDTQHKQCKHEKAGKVMLDSNNLNRIIFNKQAEHHVKVRKQWYKNKQLENK